MDAFDLVAETPSPAAKPARLPAAKREPSNLGPAPVEASGTDPTETQEAAQARAPAERRKSVAPGLSRRVSTALVPENGRLSLAPRAVDGYVPWVVELMSSNVSIPFWLGPTAHCCGHIFSCLQQKTVTSTQTVPHQGHTCTLCPRRRRKTAAWGLGHSWRHSLAPRFSLAGHKLVDGARQLLTMSRRSSVAVPEKCAEPAQDTGEHVAAHGSDAAGEGPLMPGETDAAGTPAETTELYAGTGIAVELEVLSLNEPVSGLDRLLRFCKQEASGSNLEAVWIVWVAHGIKHRGHPCV